MLLQKTIHDYYSIHVIGFIKINDGVLKLKTDQGKYYLKFVDNQNLEKHYHSLCALRLPQFVSVIINHQHHYLTVYKERYFYVMKALEEDSGIVDDMKLKFYFECLAHLHQHSFFYHQVSDCFFKEQYQHLKQTIQERMIYYQDLMKRFETLKFRSPSGWMLVLNYYRIDETLKNAYFYLDQYCKLIENKKEIRLALTYNHFDFHHVYFKERKLISIDHLKIDFCVYDLYHLYQNHPQLLYYQDCLCDHYLKHVELCDSEIRLLQCLLSIVPIVVLSQDEVYNVIQMSYFLDYLNAVKEINKKIRIDDK